MRKVFVFISIVMCGLALTVARPIVAADISTEAMVVRVTTEQSMVFQTDLGQEARLYEAEVVGGQRGGQKLVVRDVSNLFDNQAVGQKAVVMRTAAADFPDTYDIIDHYRLTSVYIVLAVFLAVVVVVARWKGLAAMMGLTATALVLWFFTIPRITAGENPVFVSVVTVFIIAVLSVVPAHGWNRRTAVALMGIAGSLGGSDFWPRWPSF